MSPMGEYFNTAAKWYIKLNIHMQKTKFGTYNLTSHGVLFSRNAGKAHTDQIMLPAFFILSEKKTLTILQKCKLQKALSPVCTLLVQLALINDFYSM